MRDGIGDGKVCGLTRGPSVDRLLMFVAVPGTRCPSTQSPLTPQPKMLSFRQNKDFQDASQQFIGRPNGRWLAVMRVTVVQAAAGRRVGIRPSVGVSQVSSDSERAGGRTRVRVRDACMLACSEAACSEACSCQSLPFSSHWPGPAKGVKDHRGQYGEGSPRKPAGACGSLRTLPVSARVCLDLETADEEGCLRGCVLEEDERPTRRREAEGKSPSLLSPCTDPGSTPVLQIPRRPKECPGSVACHVHRRRFVALLSCWASRAKSALTPHTSLCLTHPLAVCPAEPALPCRLRLESGPHLPPPEFTFSRPSPRGTSIPSTTA